MKNPQFVTKKITIKANYTLYITILLRDLLRFG